MIECKFCGITHGMLGGICEAEKKARKATRELAEALLAHWMMKNNRSSSFITGISTI